MTDDEQRNLGFVIAQLRHAYGQLDAEEVVRQRAFARGLIGPQIERLERLFVTLCKENA
jgi:cation transport regulator ChaC